MIAHRDFTTHLQNGINSVGESLFIFICVLKDIVLIFVFNYLLETQVKENENATLENITRFSTHCDLHPFQSVHQARI